MTTDNTIEVIARALIRQGDRVLLCQPSNGATWHFLPGGHVEYGESLQGALAREIEEELGLGGITIKGLIGVIENKFPVEDRVQHEINFIFDTEEIPDQPLQSKESHLTFAFHDIASLHDVNLLPKTLKEGLLDWLGTSAPFWKQFESEGR